LLKILASEVTIMHIEFHKAGYDQPENYDVLFYVDGRSAWFSRYPQRQKLVIVVEGHSVS
jgi:hypothetical protein